MVSFIGISVGTCFYVIIIILGEEMSHIHRLCLQFCYALVLGHVLTSDIIRAIGLNNLLLKDYEHMIQSQNTESRMHHNYKIWDNNVLVEKRT
jgi:hypothetical protein